VDNRTGGIEGHKLVCFWYVPVVSLQLAPRTRILTLVCVSGSWDGEIKLWALAPTLKSFSYVCSVTAAGVVNSLQLLAVPHGNVNSTAWQKQSHEDQMDDEEDVGGNAGDQVAPSKRAKMPADVLLVASVAREPRLGRWIKVKNGAKNGTLVVNLGHA
jgi:ribosomal RNA-processing protein 9